jgi:hypothetical protein
MSKNVGKVQASYGDVKEDIKDEAKRSKKVSIKELYDRCALNYF